MKKFFHSLVNIAFPVVCSCCGAQLQKKDRHICYWCRRRRFENVQDNTRDILPETILTVYSLWRFDKGGYLQDLLHNLKYNYMKGVGEEFGRILAEEFLNVTGADMLKEIESQNPILVPVPLHKSKKRKRGYNQARAVALGLKEVTGWNIAAPGEVIRVKKTTTQTGLNTQQRTRNLRGAFKLAEPDRLDNCLPVIVDDVFTTGATTFELAKEILREQDGKAVILTVARA